MTLQLVPDVDHAVDFAGGRLAAILGHALRPVALYLAKRSLDVGPVRVFSLAGLPHRFRVANSDHVHHVLLLTRLEADLVGQRAARRAAKRDAVRAAPALDRLGVGLASISTEKN